MRTLTHIAFKLAMAAGLAFMLHIGTDMSVCHEDMACWDCETMGNHRCVPLISGGVQ